MSKRQDNKEGKNNCLWFFIGIGLLLSITPVLLNLFLQIQAPRCISIIGDPTHWLSFWGAFLGGILTAGFGTISIIVTDSNHKRQLRRQEQRFFVEELNNNLSKRLASLDYSYALALLERYEDVGKDLAIQALSQLSIQKADVERLGDSWKQTLLNHYYVKPSTFDETYESCNKIFIDDIDKVWNLVHHRINPLAGADYREDVDSLREEINNHIKEQQAQLTEMMKEWINEEIQNID